MIKNFINSQEEEKMMLREQMRQKIENEYKQHAE